MPAGDAVRASPTRLPKRMRWAVRFGPFRWSRGHTDSTLRPRVRLGHTLGQRSGHLFAHLAFLWEIGHLATHTYK